ncbi:putative dna-directed rna polymerase subunit beta protein [Neofusicoccum parvum UCRNP2]|uniref:Putative dna-directed rna polymerase subunit beta protein n=1 Tax=Botryosphaeria parva (strain UCR-NP2) TaxID=1287680 RepID=R1EQX2_BOTPV|nr:putative dna-directed rna polymerase subunit beta protein [Neofusicoccum parvum UCRNP2]
MANSVFSAVSHVFRGTTEYYRKRYIETINESMKGKKGHMRKGILNCHVDGSLRQVITPHYDDINITLIPSYLQGKWMVCRLDKETNKYVSLPVKGWDHAIAIRPPTLQARSVQAVIVMFWNETCMGVTPHLLKALEEDFDGDEMHLNPVYSDGSVAECNNWANTPNRSIDRMNLQGTRLCELCLSYVHLRNRWL